MTGLILMVCGQIDAIFGMSSGEAGVISTSSAMLEALKVGMQCGYVQEYGLT